ncbi:MAG: hypothetical protein K1060chlam3_01004, partial [Candidatus Anoxychlamydiales bacterium]|nr:hypothetical protein [Candidatus Anoxychlamydiales bacterium]
ASSSAAPAVAPSSASTAFAISEKKKFDEKFAELRENLAEIKESLSHLIDDFRVENTANELNTKELETQFENLSEETKGSYGRLSDQRIEDFENFTTAIHRISRVIEKKHEDLYSEINNLEKSFTEKLSTFETEFLKLSAEDKDEFDKFKGNVKHAFRDLQKVIPAFKEEVIKLAKEGVSEEIEIRIRPFADKIAEIEEENAELRHDVARLQLTTVTLEDAVRKKNNSSSSLAILAQIIGVATPIILVLSNLLLPLFASAPRRVSIT